MDTIILTYTVDSPLNIKNYYYQNVGFDILSEQFLGDALEIVCNFEKSLPSLFVTFILENGVELYSQLEGFQANDYVMFEKCGTKSEISRIYSTTANTELIYAYGNISWTDALGKRHPCALMNIELWDEETFFDERLACGSTYLNGDFRLQYENQLGWTEKGCDVYIKLYTQGRTIKVKPGSLSDVYEYEGEVFDNHQGSNIEINLEIQHNTEGDIGQAVQIAQAAIYASQFVYERMDYVPPPECNIVFMEELITTGYSAETDRISIIKTTGYDVNYQDSWDTIMHEYGHFINYHQTGFFVPGEHYWTKDLISIYGKEKGTQLAWSEAWASMFAFMAQDYITAEQPTADYPYVGDSRVTFLNHDYDLTNLQKDSPDPGEGCELSVLAVLYEYYKKYYYSLSSMWSQLYDYNSKTLSDFVNNMGKSAWGIGEQLEKYGMASTELQLSGTLCTWNAPTGSTNNNYVVVFYTYNWNEIYRSPIISKRYYSVSNSDWNNIIQTVDDYNSTYLRWTVFTYRSDLGTGPYPSGLRVHYK